MPQEPEKNLNRYDILDRIAVGGMAEVFLAKAYGAHGFEKTLAIKRILPELARDPEFEERFIAEAKVAVRLSHTNVVQVFDFGRFAGSLFIAMEYVDGLDLAALLRRLKLRGERIPVTAAFQIAIELARGLDFAHSHGVVHRDVSPSNILLSRAGEVKIADFGIAIAATPSRGGTVTGRRKVMGKWRYMSPEQARGEQLDTRSDLFSAASVMYELFTGEKLFPGDEAEDIIRNIHDMPLPRPSEVRPGLPPRLDTILHAALARSRDDRPVRPAIMLRALTELTYESSIVSTALDVAEVVSDTIDRTTPTGKRLDAIIRAQLVGVAESTRARRTAGVERRTAGATVERQTAEGSVSSEIPAGDEAVVDHDAEPESDAADLAARATAGDGRAAEITVHARRKQSSSIPVIRDGDPDALDDGDGDDDGHPVLIQRVDSDGITRLELDETTIAGAPWPRVGEPPAMPGATERPAAADQPTQRRARAAAIATGTKGASASATEIMAAAPPRSRRLPWLVGGGAAMLAAGGLALILTRTTTTASRPLGARALDGGVDGGAVLPSAARARLVIESVPSGATGTVAGLAFGPTPATIEVPAGTVDLHLELPGRPPCTDRVNVAAGETLRTKCTFADAWARLVVDSHPAGATVLLDGARVGLTPLTLTDLTARPRAGITLEHADYLPATGTVDLVAGAEVTFERTLRPVPVVLGTIKLGVEDSGGESWGEVYLKGKKLGRAPNGALQLPLGHQRLFIKNPTSGQETWIEVDVSPPPKVTLYTAHFP